MSDPNFREKKEVPRSWAPIALAGLIPAVFAAAFLSMAWIRSQQGHGGHVFPSEIESLAVRKEPVDPLAAARVRGGEIYQHYCQICHGSEGLGDGPNSGPLMETLQTRPQDFTDGGFWERKETTEDRLRDAVSEGGPINGKSVLMPAWGHTLAESEVRDLIAFIQTFAEKPGAHGE